MLSVNKKKILILYATYGTGHKAIATYVKDYFTKYGDYEIKLIDILDYSSFVVGNFADKVFNSLLLKVILKLSGLTSCIIILNRVAAT